MMVKRKDNVDSRLRRSFSPIDIFVGTPQGSVLAATLFRLHVYFLPSIFMNLTCYLFADDLAIVISGALENKFSKTIVELEKQAEVTMKVLEKYANDNLLPVNTNKTNPLLVHDVVVPSYPKVKYKVMKIDFVKRFKYLGVDITVTILSEEVVVRMELHFILLLHIINRIVFIKNMRLYTRSGERKRKR
jgi:hypothetical protein